MSKAGNVLHAAEFAKRAGGEGIIRVVCSALLLRSGSPPADDSIELESWEFEDGSSTPYA